MAERGTCKRGRRWKRLLAWYDIYCQATNVKCIDLGTRFMSTTHVVVEGTLKPDGSLQLDSKLNLPPGRVQLIVQPLPELPKNDPFWQMMQRIWAARAEADLGPRGTE